MKSSRISEERIIGILKQGEAGVKATDLCRQHCISDHTSYRWKSKYVGMEVSEAKKLKPWKRRTASSNSCWERRNWTSWA